jgi:primosomal protein N'
MLPAADLTEILTNLSALNLQPNIAAQILAAVLAPLLRSAEPEEPAPPRQRAIRPRAKPRRAVRQKRKKSRPRAAAQSAPQSGAQRTTAAGEPRDGQRQRAIAALKANPGVSLTKVAAIAGVSRSTVANARNELTAEARKPREPKTERRERAQSFLKDALAHGPKQVSAVEEAAAKAHVDPQALEQARTALGIVTSRGNTGGVQAVQWSLPG